MIMNIIIRSMLLCTAKGLHYSIYDSICMIGSHDCVCVQVSIGGIKSGGINFPFTQLTTSKEFNVMIIMHSVAIYFFAVIR